MHPNALATNTAHPHQAIARILTNSALQDALLGKLFSPVLGRLGSLLSVGMGTAKAEEEVGTPPPHSLLYPHPSCIITSTTTTTHTPTPCRQWEEGRAPCVPSGLPFPLDELLVDDVVYARLAAAFWCR
jgi:hypothetical protein